jgi:mannose-6-phosphate isomerase-like protein (cupin superfamily)
MRYVAETATQRGAHHNLKGKSVAGEHTTAQARRVVSGLDQSGKSTVVADESTPVRLQAPGMTICDIWQVGKLPVNVIDDDATTGHVLLNPPSTGWVYRVTTKAPDSEWDVAGEYGAMLEAMGSGDALQDDGSGLAGLHQSETVDIVTVVSGELVAVLETQEVTLRPGDSFVTRGVKHSWSNRTDKPVVLVCLQAGAIR